MSTESPIAPLQGIHHVRVTVTDIARSKTFYSRVFGREPRIDVTEQVGEPGVSEDPQRFYGGCVFEIEGQLFGLRPVADAGDRFDSTRSGSTTSRSAWPARPTSRRPPTGSTPPASPTAA